MAPLVLPPVVTGYLLLKVFGRNGVLAPVLEAAGVQVAFTRWGAVIAAAVVGFPLLLILVRQAIESVDVRYPAIAQTLGLSPLQAFWRVTLPMALPGIAAGCVLAFARALGEFGATAMIAGDQPGETRTLALAVYALAEVPGGEDAAATLVWISLGLCAVALVAYERLVWRQRRRTSEVR
jgi:molybdate transport system permease protein